MAFRGFRRSPGFAATVVLTLALGIAATTAMFSLVDGILLRPLPFPRADRLVAIDTLEFPPGVTPTSDAEGWATGTSYPNFFDWQRQNHSFESLASYEADYRLFSKASGENARVIPCGRVSANFFETLGVPPALGRTFNREEEQGGHRVAILSHELWVSDFGSSPEVLGQIVKISDDPSVVVGVMPAGFHYPIGEPAMFWATYAADNEGPEPQTAIRDSDRLGIVGRLKSGVSTAQGKAELSAIQRALAQQYSENRNKPKVVVSPMLDEAVSEVRPALLLLLGAVGMVLLIGCANVAGLLLARATARRPEVALRTALGASRSRVVRQLLTEALLLAAAGGIVGIAASVVALRVGLQFLPTDLPRIYNITIDFRVLAFAVWLSGCTALIFGLFPAWRMSHCDPADALRESGVSATSSRRHNRLHHGLVVAETALGFSLLIGSGLLIKSLVNLLHLDPGFDTKGTAFFDVALTKRRYPDPSKVAFYNKLLPELGALPGVERVASGHPLPILWGRDTWTNFTITGQVNSTDDLPGAGAIVTTPGFFETLSIPLLRGRTFTEHDNDPKSSRVAIINRSFERRYFAGVDPIGHYITPTFEHTGEPVVAREIIGVVGNTETSESGDPYPPQFYLPYAQDPTHQRPVVVMKVAGDPLTYEDTIRKVVAALDRDAPVFEYQTFAEGIQAQTAQPRFEAALISCFAGTALLLSAVGLYAVLSFVVAARIREMGLRMALGASRSDVLHLVLRRALLLTSLGVGIGGLVSIFAARLVRDILFRVEPLDRAVFLIVTLVLLCVSVIAAIAPALRAAQTDPMRTLREQ